MLVDALPVVADPMKPDEIVPVAFVEAEILVVRPEGGGRVEDEPVTVAVGSD